MYSDPTTCSFVATQFRRDELVHLVEVMKELGIEVTCELSSSGRTAKLDFVNIPSVFDAEIKRTRRAGRWKKRFFLPRNSIFNNDTSAEEFLEWLKHHTTEEAMEQLGIDSRATYFRRLKSLKERLAHVKLVNSRNEYQLPLPTLDYMLK